MKTKAAFCATIATFVFFSAVWWIVTVDDRTFYLTMCIVIVGVVWSVFYHEIKKLL